MARSRNLALGLTLLVAASARADVLDVPGDYATIQEAILAASDFDQINVAAGTWAGPIATLDLDIEIRALEGPHVTVIDGLGAPQVVLAGLGAGISTAQLVGFTLTGGVDGAATTELGTLWLTNCIVRDNAGVGGRGSVMAIGSTFTGNGSHGLDTFKSALNCTFQDNGGWGVQDLDGVIGGPQVDSCRFLGNGLGGARLAVFSPNAAFPAEIHVTNCIFVDDNLQVSTAEVGGVGQSIVRHVSLLGGTVKLMQGELVVTDSILRSTTPITDFSGSGDPLVSYSDLPGAWLPGTGTIDADPLWADPDGGDFSLLPGSPCINTGAPALSKDPDESPHDMGAVTYHPWTDLGGAITIFGSVTVQLVGKGPLIAGESMGFSLVPELQEGVWLVVSATELGVPFKGGTLWPAVDAVFGPLFPLFGKIAAGLWPVGLPPGTTFVAQAWWPEPTAMQGWAASSGVRGVQP